MTEYIYQRIACSLLIALIASCSQNIPPTPQTSPPKSPPPDSWMIEAKLGVRTKEESGSVTLTWKQNKKDYDISIRGPFGQGSATIKGNDRYIFIEQPGKATRYSDTPSALIKEVFGWELPINDFKFWTQGRASIEHPIEDITYTPSGNISSLQQLGWQISYSRYKLFDKWQLPGRIKAKLQHSKLTLVIREWTLL